MSKSLIVAISLIVARLAFAEVPSQGPAQKRPGAEKRARTDRQNNFWSFQPVERPIIPSIKRADWGSSPIDAFVLAKLEAAGLAPSPPAGKTALLRRAHYDLIGLPPPPEQVDAFLADSSPDAFEKVIDQLLESPQYGERWARHWLDLVRYAETNSYERDGAKPNVWRFRDYVIQSLNQDKPYDQFIVEQLAGDELEQVTPERLIATGYYRLGIWQDEPVDRVKALYDDLDDILSTTSQVFLGLTINCARCHDHKLDPIPQKDYYRMLAFFAGVQRYGVRSPETVARNSLRAIATEAQRKQEKAQIAAHEQRVAQTNQQIAAIEKIVFDDFSPVEKEDFKHQQNRIAIVKKRLPELLSPKSFKQYVALTRQRRALERFRPSSLSEALCVTEIGAKPRNMFVLIRGNPQAQGDPVEPGFPSVLDPPEPLIREPKKGAESSGRRLALAHWIASKDNPLTARVMVNRIWQYHFGRGIVRSPNNFGYQGTPPTHPELLDWLASEFVQRGWRLKAMHKLIMLSNTYQMSSRASARALARDPENDLFWRFQMRRLEAEEVRDSILAVNGSLNRKMGGPSIYPIIPQDVLAGQSRPGSGWGKSSRKDRTRRSIYIHIKRSLITPILASFDAADTDATCPVRFSTTQPTQALGMLNGDFLNEQARVFAHYLRENAGAEPPEQVVMALRRALQREPSPAEIERGLELIESLQENYQTDAKRALEHFCLVVLNLNEFIYLD